MKYGCRWRDRPRAYGPHTTIYNRFNHWSKDGTWQAMWDALVRFDAAHVQIVDSTVSKAHRCSAGGEGGEGGEAEQQIGISRGGRTAKAHAVADACGRVIAFGLTQGQRGDSRPPKALLKPLPAPRHLLADTAYDADYFRSFLTERGTVPVIRPNPTRKNVPDFDGQRYKDRNVIERAFCRLKDRRRVATRYDRLARNFRATVILAVLVIWWA